MCVALLQREVSITIFSAIIGPIIILFVLWEGFETIVSPQRVTRKLRLTRFFYRSTWLFWTHLAARFVPARRRETFLSVYGPLSLLFLLSIWAATLIFGFGLVHLACGSVADTGGDLERLVTSAYYSGTTFFTLGLGDLSPHTLTGRILTVIEAGLGIGFLALIISYLPVLNQSFAARETNISMLDSRAGSPPTASAMLRRHARGRGVEDLRELLYNWEHWAAELLESHLSYPVLAYFRSQHENQSWLSALTSILDISAFLISCEEKHCGHQAELTFAIARHAVVDLAIVFNLPPKRDLKRRLLPEELMSFKGILAHDTFSAEKEEGFEQRLEELCDMYEPYVRALADHFFMPLPGWAPSTSRKDNWQTSAWQGPRLGPGAQRQHRHF